jgi:hypothetical protein
MLYSMKKTQQRAMASSWRLKVSGGSLQQALGSELMLIRRSDHGDNVPHRDASRCNGVLAMLSVVWTATRVVLIRNYKVQLGTLSRLLRSYTHDGELLPHLFLRSLSTHSIFTSPTSKETNISTQHAKNVLARASCHRAGGRRSGECCPAVLVGAQSPGKLFVSLQLPETSPFLPKFHVLQLGRLGLPKWRRCKQHRERALPDEGSGRTTKPDVPQLGWELRHQSRQHDKRCQ